MTNRFTRALRVLLGKPHIGLAIDGTMLIDSLNISEFDYTRRPPSELAYLGAVADEPPVKVVRAKNFRICVFPETNGNVCDCCGGQFHWLVFEYFGNGSWYRLLTLHDSNFEQVMDVLEALGKFFVSTKTGSGTSPQPAEA